MTAPAVANKGDTAQADANRIGRVVFAGAVVAFLAIAAPIVWRGAPLADDFNNCVAPRELGLTGFIATSWRQLGAIRPARFLEILLGAAVCGSAPFGLAILVPLLLTLMVAWQARGLLRDFGTPAAWANVGAALWLLQPLGTEAGLWPAALHVPLGLALALGAIRLYHRGRFVWGAAANLAAALSVEQVILPLPLAAWMLAPERDRRRALAISLVSGAMAVAGFLLAPGANPRLHTSLFQRLAGLVADPAFYVGYPVVGLGLHSIPLAVWWALPWSAAVLAAGALVGSVVVLRLTPASRPVTRREMLRGATFVAALIALANAVVVLAVPHQGSPRVFAPTWLILSLAAAAAASAARWRGPRIVGAAAGIFGAGAVLSLALSVSVRLRNADFAERAAALIAARVPEHGRIAVCQVRRSVVEPAPRGAFAVHELIYDWAAERALLYYTQRHATFVLAGEMWNTPCPAVPDVDVVIGFDELMAGARR
jgi:hypothetical protein